MAITKAAFGKLPDGTPVDLFTLTNSKGMTAKITNYGGHITELHVPDKTGKTADVVLGFPDLAGYLGSHPYMGATIGRFANRIAGGKFTLDGKTYHTPINNGPNTLHGGTRGFDKVVWKASVKGNNLELTYVSPNGDQGFPGMLTATVSFTLTDLNELAISFEAIADAPTPVNLCNHAYFNLAGAGHGDILDHVLQLNAEAYTPVDAVQIPTGQIAPVAGTPFDFRQPKPIGRDIGKVPSGYDHNYVLNHATPGDLTLAAVAAEPISGRVMEVLTTQPGVQFYTGNFLDGSVRGIGGAYQKHAGFCLETQHFPDSVNKPNFPSTILRPGQTYHQRAVYRFKTA